MSKFITQKYNAKEPNAELKTLHAFVFASYHPDKSLMPETLLSELAEQYHLNFYSPSQDEYKFSSFETIISQNKEQWEQWGEHPPEGVNSGEAYENFYLKKEYGYCESQFHSKWINLPSCGALFLFLSNELMISLPNLLLLMESQKNFKNPMTVFPFLLEPVILNCENEEYENFLAGLKKEITILPEEAVRFRELLVQTHENLRRNSNYAGFGEESIKTFTEIEKYLQEENPVFTQALCYRVFQEIVNSLECNFINLLYYQQDTMSILYNELVSRIHSSIPSQNIPLAGSAAWVKGLDLSEFHILRPEECEIVGDVLVKLHSKESKIAIAFPLKKIASNACSYCFSLEELILPQGLEIVENLTFHYSVNLRRVYLPDSVIALGAWMFSFCDSLEEIVIPRNVTHLPSNCFASCTSLKKVRLPEGLKVIETLNFSDCISLESINLPAGLEELTDNLFQNTLSLYEITLPSTVAKIGERAFFHSALREVHLPESVQTVGDYAFCNCYQLKAVHQKEGVEYLGENVFNGCFKLKD